MLLGAGCVHVPDQVPLRHADPSPLTKATDALIERNVSDVAEEMFRAALVRCALPMMEQVRVPRLIIRYRYDGQRADIEANDAQLVPRLRGCAMPETGPTLSFTGQVTIWRARDDER
jgi:hypothetical protein